MASEKAFENTSDRSLDAYLFHQGTHTRAYEYLGCSAIQLENGYSYTFRTWAPGALSISVVGDFCDWHSGLPMTKITDGGIWELVVFSEKSYDGLAYKFRIASPHGIHMKGDPYARASRGGDDGASIITKRSSFPWQDSAWLSARKRTICSKKGRYLPTPINIYELHLASFARREDGGYLSYRELAERLVGYVKALGYTHIEILPITEYPFDASWGYQVGAFFAPTSRFGTPDDFRAFVSAFHRAGIGVILDWVPAHFPKDAWGLFEFDGRPLYEYQGKDRMESRSWGTRFFDVGREEVQSFLISSAMFWLREFHIDGLRVDAVSSMLYLDYDRMPGEWVPNFYGGNLNLEAIAFLKKLNQTVYGEFPDVLMIAEESTAFGRLTHPVSSDGLGFALKWNMGWANDFYDYLSLDPVYRKYHHTALNFPLMYAFGENYVLPISHDEVVHGKRSLIGKISGSYEDKFKQMRTALLLQMTYPGKKLLFMGTEFAQFREWDYDSSLEWFMLEHPNHFAMREYVASLGQFYLQEPALWEQDFVEDGFSWIDPDDRDHNLVSFRRRAIDRKELIVVLSFSGAELRGYKIPVFDRGEYEIVFESLGSGSSLSSPLTDQDGNTALTLDLPPFAGVVIKRKKKAGRKKRSS
ncbi:MAG: 1,4-alpha-glucan branching protein GlgB [Clostridia bacterium]|nr:1,4-alpha-glucan branching protein GlgB [Clostridia bacterium]